MTQLDARALRKAFGNFMTGVTVVTSRNPEGKPVGFTANSFTSVSLDPPLLLVCPGNFLSSYETFSTCKSFSVNILAEGQEEVSNTFASYKGDRFARVPHRFDSLDNPLIDNAVAQFSCVTRQIIPAGDHCILVGEVVAFTHAGGRGLGYWGGQYFSLGLERAALEQETDVSVFGAIIRQGDNILLESTAKGLRPLQIERSDLGSLRHDLSEEMAARGVPVRLGAVYSIFEDDGIRYTYLLASARTNMNPPVAETIRSLPVSRLSEQAYATQPVADMMKRYAIEAQTSSFGLYLGDGKRGSIHSLS